MKLLELSFHPKLISSDWNGVGCHTIYSNQAIRVDRGIGVIKDVFKFHSKRYDYLFRYCELGNEKRLKLRHKTTQIVVMNW